MDSDKIKKYIVGTPANLQKLFPQYAGNDIRKSFDEKLAIYEVNLTDDELSTLKKNKTVKIYTHEEILILTNAPESAGIWYVTSGYSRIEENTPSEENL